MSKKDAEKLFAYYLKMADLDSIAYSRLRKSGTYAKLCFFFWHKRGMKAIEWLKQRLGE